MFLYYMKGIRAGRRFFLQLPGNGQRTRSKGRHSHKNNIFLLKFLVDIYVKYFNFVYPVNSRVFFRAQVLNKLFYYNWNYEWLCARIYAYKLMGKKSRKLQFNLEKASAGQLIGYPRTGAAGKRGKARSKITSVSVGMPVNMLKYFVLENNKIYKYSITTK